MAKNDPDAALHWIDQACPLADARTAAVLEVWRAEILSRAGRPDAALSAYRGLIGSGDPAAGAVMALDAAETLIDNGHIDQARSLLDTARDLRAPPAAAESSAGRKTPRSALTQRG